MPTVRYNGNFWRPGARLSGSNFDGNCSGRSSGEDSVITTISTISGVLVSLAIIVTIVSGASEIAVSFVDVGAPRQVFSIKPSVPAERSLAFVPVAIASLASRVVIFERSVCNLQLVEVSVGEGQTKGKETSLVNRGRGRMNTI
jgi:hypothetical protein